MPIDCWSPFKSLHAYESRQVAVEDLVRPWMGAGPFFHDLSEEVTGRSFFEDLESDTGEKTFRRCLAEGETCLADSPVEGDPLTYLGETLCYEVIDHEEPLLNWGRYFRGNTLVAQFVSTRAWAEKAGPARFRMLVRIDNQVVVAVNGKVQYRSFEEEFVRTNNSWLGERSCEFELNLSKGENILSIGAFRLGRIAGGAMFLQTLSAPLQVSLPLRSGSAGIDRVKEETIRDLFYPPREWFYPGDPIRLLRQKGTNSDEGEIECTAMVKGKIVARKRIPISSEEVTLCMGTDIDSHTFQIRTTAIVEGTKLADRTFQCTRVAPSPAGVQSYETRRQFVLEHFAKGRDAWAQVARYALGRSEGIDGDVIADGCQQIDRRLDCADFVLHPFLRLMHADRGRNELPADIAQQLTESALNFRYWTDEPGSDCLVTGTENHQILFHTAEIIAGHLWPDETFSNSGMSGRDHVEHGRRLAVDWLVNRAKTGFREWHSSSYYPHWIAALLDLYDCVPEEESRLREMAGNALTVGCLNLASDSFAGALVTTHGRVYAPMLKVPDTDGCSGMHWLLYGEGHLRQATGVVPLAAGGFRPPAFFTQIARTNDCVTLAKHHQGNDARFIVYRTPDYLLSALQNHRPGERAAQVHPFQLTFRDKVAVFFSCPESSNEGSGHRPDYWSGNGYLPRVFAERNAAVLLFQPGQVGWMSHCYFERDRFDEVVEKEGWLFARKRDGYVGIWSECGYEVGSRGQYAGRELICRAGPNAWIVEAGRRADWDSFEVFVGALMKVRPHRDDTGRIVYSSPSVGSLQMGWEGPILLDGEEVDTDYPLLDSPYGYSEYGSGRMTLRYGDEEVELGAE